MGLTPTGIISSLHQQCGHALVATFADGRDVQFASCYMFVEELSAWTQAVAERKEAFLVDSALSEYSTSMLSLAQGQYRSAYKSLRAVLELCLQAAFLSVDELSLRQWLYGNGQTRWAAITGEGGIFDKPYRQAFFPELEDKFDIFQGLATAAYKELSEHVHSNPKSHTCLPRDIRFDEASFLRWLELADTVRIIVQFSFAARYLRDLSADKKTLVAAALMDHLGHIETIRIELGSAA